MYNFFNPTRVLFGAGQLNHLHEQAMPGKKAMVVISNGKSTRENGSLDRTMNELHQAGVETVLFDKVGANPLKSAMEEGGRFARDRRSWRCMPSSREIYGTMWRELPVRCSPL